MKSFHFMRNSILILTSLALAPALAAESGWSLEKFNGIGGPAVSNLTTAANFYSASSTSIITSPAIPSNSGDNYGSRIRGFVIAPVTGEYTFWESGDDAVQLYLSPDENPANKTLIAYHSPGTSGQQWDKYPTQKSRAIPLVAGEKYYIEALHKEGTGNDHLAIAWTVPGASRALIPLSAMETYSDAAPATTAGLSTQIFANFAGASIADFIKDPNYPHTPFSTITTATGEGPSNIGDNFASRTRGWVIPPTTGNYNFWISGDQSVQLFLSPSANSSDKQLIAQCGNATNPQQWNKFSSQKSRSLTLTAGKAYYIEILHREGTGSDHFAAAWTTPAGTFEILPATALQTWVTHPSDFDDDLIADAKEALLSLDPSDPSDGYADTDGDTIPNHREYAHFNHPTLLDSVHGHLNDHVWFNVSGDKLNKSSYKAAATRPCDAVSHLTGAQSADVGDQYVRRYRGFITAPLTGQYQFWLTADDDADFHLSTTSSKFNLVHIIRNEVLGGETSFDIDPSQKSAPIALQAGEKYYFEMWHKEQTGSGNAAVAWKISGGSRQIIPAYYLSSFIFDPDDLDDDDLPDSYEIANGLNPNDDGRSPGSTDGAYGDLDGDGLTNKEEWKNNTAANLIDTDGDGVSDYDEVHFFGSATLANAIGAFTSVATLDGGEYTSSTGGWASLGGKAYQESRRGSVTYPITVPASGIYALKFDVISHVDGAKSEQHDFHLKIDGIHLAYKTVSIASDSQGVVAVLTPWLQAGQTYHVECFVDNSYNWRRVIIDKVEILAAGGVDSNNNDVPDWTEIRVNDHNGLDQQGSMQSKTSPAVLEGKARYLDLMVTNAPTPVAAPDGRFFCEVPLNAQTATALDFNFENQALEQSVHIHWAPTNLKLESDIIIRQGDSLLLTAYHDAENAGLESYSYTVNGTSAGNTANIPIPQAFQTPGTFPLHLNHTDAEGNTTSRSINITVLPRLVPGNPPCVVDYLRDWTPPTVPAGASIVFDGEVVVQPSETAGNLRIGTSTPINQPLVVRSSGGLILGSGMVKSFSVRGGDSTGLQAIGMAGSLQQVEMPIVAYGDIGGAEIRCVIFQGGVTFADGTTSQSMNSSSFDTFHTTVLEFLRPLSAYAVCHEYRIFDGNQRIAFF